MDLIKLLEIWIRVQRAGLGVSDDLTLLFEKYGKRARKIINNKNTAVIRKVAKVRSLIGDNFTEIGALLSDDLARVGVAVQNNMITALGTAAGAIQPVKVTKKLVRQSLLYAHADNTSVDGMLRSLKVRNTGMLTNIIYRSAQEGLGSRAVGVEIQNVFNYNTRQSVLIGRTATNAVSNESLQRMYSSNQSIIDRIRVIATLDHRTSDICVQMDGTIYSLADGQAPPRPPYHIGCRTVTAPIFKNETLSDAEDRYSLRTAVEPKSVEDLKNKGLKTRTGKVRKPNATRTSGDSPLYRKNTRSADYESWLRKQPKTYQQAILGKSAGSKFREGASIKDVLANRASAITVQQLQRTAL